MRRSLPLAIAAFLMGSGRALAFGDEGAFHPRVLSTSGKTFEGIRHTGPSRWAWELVRRTSAPGRLVTEVVQADDPKLLDEPFLIWTGETAIGPLSGPELRGLRQYLLLGGILFVDDANPASGEFGASAKRELGRVIAEAPVVRLDPSHVLYKSYYLIERPVGRVIGEPYWEAIVRGRTAQVIFSAHDLLGALARADDGAWAMDVEGGYAQRQQAIRMAVNVAMYVLCSDYKDDQVHAEELMRRRGRRPQ